jgi:hypothetical protein
MLLARWGVVDFQRDAIVIAEIELSQVAVQMFRVAMLVDASHAALEDRNTPSMVLVFTWPRAYSLRP